MKNQILVPTIAAQNRTVLAFILAAGSGRRFDADIPKQFVELAGHPVVGYSVAAFREAGLEPVVVIQESWRRFCEGEMGVVTIEGGATRTESVRRAVEFAEKQRAEYLFLHAASRPFITSLLISHMLAHRSGWDALVCAELVSGSLLDRSSGKPVSRQHLVLTYSPELILISSLKKALALSSMEEILAVDAIARTGGRIGLVMWSGPNLKITRIEDFDLAKRLILTEPADNHLLEPEPLRADL
jgi:2-C-methyl-D-erythritol 4-phosphate cytidylyltransferase